MKNWNDGDTFGVIFIGIIITIFLFLVQPAKAADTEWGKTGHRVIGQIAQDNLTPEARGAINLLLGGETLATVSTYAD